MVPRYESTASHGTYILIGYSSDAKKKKEVEIHHRNTIVQKALILLG